jgi:hypothetical protein
METNIHADEYAKRLHNNFPYYLLYWIAVNNLNGRGYYMHHIL